MTLQGVLTPGTFGMFTAQAAANRVELKTGEPDEAAFSLIYVETGTAVGGEGDTLSMRFHLELNDEWLESKLYEYVDDGILEDPGDYQGNYDDYLNGFNDETLPSLSFTCAVSDGVLDVQGITEYIESNKDIITTGGEKIGHWSVEESSIGPVFKITLDKKVYARMNVVANRGLEAQLLERFQPGDAVVAGPGSGGADLNITINGAGEPIATNSDYVMEKAVEVGGETENADRMIDPSAINFTISVRASASNAEKSRMATGTGWATLATSTATSNQIATITDLDDEIPFDQRDGDLVFDWWNFSAPVKSNIVRRDLPADTELDLTGKYIVDSISSDLNLDAVEISYDGGLSWKRLDAEEVTGEASWEAYLEKKGRLFSYEIPDQDGGPVQEFDIRLYTRISNDLWIQYGTAGELHRTFPNKAILKDEDGTKTLTLSNQVEPSIDWNSLIHKGGRPLDVNGNTFQWTIDVDAYFSGGVRLYLIDYIENVEVTHEYILDDQENHPVRIEDQNGKSNIFDVIDLSENGVLTETDLGSIAGKQFKKITINDIESFLGKDKFNDGKVYSYKYETTIAEGQTQINQIMLIPMQGFTNGQSTIYYDTNIQAAKNSEELEYETHLSNEVRPVWKWYGGLGPGEKPFGSITAKKGYDVKVKVVNKNSGEYNAAENTIPWIFDVNQRGVELDRVLIVDDLAEVKDSEGNPLLEWSGLGQDYAIELTPVGRIPEEETRSGGSRMIEYVDPTEWKPDENSSDDYYTIENDTKLKVHLGPIGADEYYQFIVKTSVQEGNYASDKQWTITNQATATATVGGTVANPENLEASCTVKHTLLQKDVEPFKTDAEESYLYDYENNAVQWKITINPDNRTINGAVLTDNLPLGTTFGKIVSAKRGDTVEGEVSDDGLSVAFENEEVTLENKEGTGQYSGIANKNYSKDTVTFTFPETINKTYEFVFTTTVDEDFRREIVKSDDEDGELLVNKAKLEGTIDGITISGAEDDATNPIMPQPLLKEGKYHPMGRYSYREYNEDGNLSTREMDAVWFTWTAYVNRTNVDMTGAKVWDTLEECFELIPASMNVDVVKLNVQGQVEGEATGIVENGRQITGKDELTDWKLDEGGFRFTIPDAYKKDTLRLTFDTVLVDDAVASQMVNTIHAEGGDWQDASSEASDDNAADFRLEDYANADGMIFLRVLKSSSNHDAGKLYLEGAEFSLQKMKLDENGNKTDISDWNEHGSVKIRKTRANGALSFLFLQPDVIYKLEETQAPTGYEKTNKIWYVVAKLQNKTAED